MEINILESGNFNSKCYMSLDTLNCVNCNVTIEESDINELNNKDIKFTNCVIYTKEEPQGECKDCRVIWNSSKTKTMVKKYGIEYDYKMTKCGNTGMFLHTYQLEHITLLFNTEVEMLEKLADTKKQGNYENLKVFTIDVDISEKNKKNYQL